MRLTPLSSHLRDRYLRHLGLDGQLGPPSVEALTALHRAQLDQVPYENIEIQLGHPTTIDPAESAKRILTRRGGYCYHLNGAFGALLASVGYDVTLARGAVPDAGGDGRWLGNHLVLLINVETATWVADVGLGDGFRDPVPLDLGQIHQPPFAYQLQHHHGSRWRFEHDPRSTITGFDFDITPVDLEAFAAMHQHLSSSPDSPFVRVFVMQSRRADHTVALRGCVLTRTDAAGRVSRDVTDVDEWFGLLAETFDVMLEDAETRQGLWQRVHGSHETWDRAGRP